jgi:hypothetical protein
LAFVFWFGEAGFLNGVLKIMQPRQRNAHFSSAIDYCKIGTFFDPGAVMQIYYPSLSAIQQQTMQLDHAQCAHCQQSRQLVSHGFIRKKRVGAEPEAVGKRVFCSNRNHRTGCGRTMQLYLAATVRYLHHAGCSVVAFVWSLMAGMTIQHAYRQATGAATPRHAYRWLNRLRGQLSAYRSLSHRPLLQEPAPNAAANRSGRLASLMSTFKALLQRFGHSLCAAYQGQLQRPFL